MVIQDTYLQPNAPDPVLAEAAVMAIVRRYAPNARAVTAVDESGGEARAYAIDRDIILKTQRPHRLRPRTSMEKEAFFLRQLAADPSIPVPRLLGYGTSGGTEYSCLTRMPGVAFQHAGLSDKAKAGVLRAAGRALRKVHQLPLEPFVQSGLFPGDAAPSDFRRRLEAAFMDAVKRLDDAHGQWPLAESPERVAAHALAMLPETTELAPLHSNPGPPHVFVTQDEKFSGFIDFGDAYISHPAMDFRPWREPADLEALLAGYGEERPLSPGFMACHSAGAVLGEMTDLARGRVVPEQAMARLELLRKR